MVPFEAFLSEKPVVTTTDAGGPLDVVHDRRHRPRRRAAAAVARACAGSRARGRGADVGEGGQGDRRAGDVGRAIDRPRSRGHEGRLLLAAPAVPLGDRRLQRTAPARARAADRRRSSRRRAAGARRADVALYHIGNDPDAHGWIVEALRARPGRRRAARVRAPPPRRRADARPRATARGYLDAMEREAGSPAACSPTGSSTTASRRSGRRGRRRSRWPARCSGRATGLIVHSRYVEERARARRFRRPGLADPASGLAVPAVAPRPVEGTPADRLLRPPEREQAHPAAPRRVRAAPRRADPEARLLLVGASADSPRPRLGDSPPEGVDPARIT